MAAVAGRGGSVKIGAATVASIKNWSLDINLDTLDITALGKTWKEFIAGLREWSGSLEGDWDVQTDVTGQKAIQDALLNGTAVTLELYVNAANKYSGSAFITAASPSADVGDLVSISFDFQGTGALAYA